MKRSAYDSFSHIKYIKISPFKLRKIVNVVRGMDVNLALQTLALYSQKGSKIVSMAIHSAYANAAQKDTLDSSAMMIKDIIVNEAPTQKRHQPRARGKSFSILKRSSHIMVGLVQKTGGYYGTKN